MQHKNRLKFAISTPDIPSDLETKLIIDSTAIYLKVNTFCFGDMTFSGNVYGLTSTMLGIGNVANTAPSDYPVSTLQQTALNLKANLASPTFTEQYQVQLLVWLDWRMLIILLTLTHQNQQLSKQH